MASGQGHGTMSLSMKLIRLLIVLFNLVFVVIGSVLLAIGIYLIKDTKIQQLRPLLNPDITSKYSGLSNIEIFAISLAVIGGVLLLIGFFGCCGALKGFRFLHILYAIIIGIIILAEIAIIIVFIVYQNRFQNEFVYKLQTSIANYYGSTDNSTGVSPITLAWNYAQFNLQCCGAINASDYLNATNWNRTDPYQPNTTLTVPFSCCPVNVSQHWNGFPRNMTDANTCAITGINAYSEGCYDRLVDLLSQYKTNIIIGGCIVGAVEIFAILFAILLYCRKKDYEPL